MRPGGMRSRPHLNRRQTWWRRRRYLEYAIAAEADNLGMPEIDLICAEKPQIEISVLFHFIEAGAQNQASAA